MREYSDLSKWLFLCAIVWLVLVLVLVLMLRQN